VLQTLVGYADHPSGIQVLFYVATLAGITILTRLYGGASSAPKAQSLNAAGA
jgi:high-affinity Fe2+/Pb2+ permease